MELTKQVYPIFLDIVDKVNRDRKPGQPGAIAPPRPGEVPPQPVGQEEQDEDNDSRYEAYPWEIEVNLVPVHSPLQPAPTALLLNISVK
jgi:hypothetical protein